MSSKTWQVEIEWGVFGGEMESGTFDGQTVRDASGTVVPPGEAGIRYQEYTPEFLAHLRADADAADNFGARPPRWTGRKVTAASADLLRALVAAGYVHPACAAGDLGTTHDDLRRSLGLKKEG
jgi:hypothetical protein